MIINACASLDLKSEMERGITADSQVWNATMPLITMYKLIEKTDFRKKISSYM